MLFIDVHVWTYCRNMSVVKILRLLARAGGNGYPQALATDMSWGVGRRAGGSTPNPPTTQTLVITQETSTINEK